MIKNEFYEEVKLVHNDMHSGVEIDKSLINRLNSLGHKVYNYHYDDERVVTSSSLDIIIFEMPDEWYYIFSSISRKYYKCDQFEGLAKCLSDLNTLLYYDAKKVQGG